MKWFKFLLLMLIGVSLGLTNIVHAQSNAPQFINFQGVLVDEGGNVLYDVQQADIRCSVVDGAGIVLYEEIQPDTTLVSGAISILCGNGVDPNTGIATGGIPYDVFSPDGSRLLRVQVNDSIPQEEVEIVSVPYSYYSQFTLGLVNPLEADDITAGVITRTHLHDDLWSQIVDLGFGEGDLDSHRIESGAHPATSISIENTFVNAPGMNLQQILQGLDNAISIRGNQGGVLGDQISQEINDRQAADAAEVAAREAAIATEIAAREAAVAAETAARDAAIAAEALARDEADDALGARIDDESTVREDADINLQDQIDDISTSQQGMPPVGTIIPFYDFDGALPFDPEYWAYCDGRTVAIDEIGSRTLPDLSGRYLVGFGSDGAGNIDSAGWTTAAIGNVNHRVNLRHSHGTPNHNHSIASHNHTVSHSHTLSGHSHYFANSHSHSIGSSSHYHTGTALQINSGSRGFNTSGMGLALNLDARTGQHIHPLLMTNSTHSHGGSTGSETVGGWTGGPNVGSTNVETPTTSAATLNTNLSGTGTTGSSLSTTQSIQPRSVRVRYVMRIK